MINLSAKENEEIFKMPPITMLTQPKSGLIDKKDLAVSPTTTTHETFNYINSEIAKGNEWMAYNTASHYLRKDDLFFFKTKDEARDFSNDNISDFDSFAVIKAISVQNVLKQIPDGEQRLGFSATFNIQVPDNIAGHKLHQNDKQRLLLEGQIENLGGFTSGKTLTLVEDPVSKELSLRLSQLVVGKDPKDIFEVSRLVYKREISSAPYIESSGLKNELQKSGIDAPLILKEPFLINVLPTETKELEKKSSIAESRGQKYAVISHSSTDNISFHTSLKEAADLAKYSGGSLVKTKDLKESIAYQKEGGDINITTNDNTVALKKDRNMKISW